MRPKGIWNIVAALAVVALAWSCAQNPNAPTLPPTGQNQNVTVNVNTGGGASPAPSSCVSPDRVDIQVPGTIQHGQSSPISATPVVANQVQNTGVCNITWVAQQPCSVANTGAFSTTMTASQQDLTGCFIYAKVGTVSSQVAIVAVN